MKVSRRLEQLEAQVAKAEQLSRSVIVVYDVQTGQPFARVPDSATVTFWVPDNGRGDNLQLQNSSHSTSARGASNAD